MSGDLKELYEIEVLDAPDGEGMMYVVDIMCENYGPAHFWTILMSSVDNVSCAFKS